MGAIASQITSLAIVYSTFYSDADQSKHQSSTSLAFVQEIHRGPVNFPHKWPVTRKMSPFDDVIMLSHQHGNTFWITGWIPSQRDSNVESIGVFTVVRLNKLLSKQWRCQCFQRPWCSCHTIVMSHSDKQCYAQCQLHNKKKKSTMNHDDIIKWKYFPYYWPFVRGIHQSIPHTKASEAELWCFLWSVPEQTLK